jgi:hypothetical protein
VIPEAADRSSGWTTAIVYDCRVGTSIWEMEALGAENFASLFDVEQSLSPTKSYTESSCQFPSATRVQLSLIGVRQIVAIAAK